MGKHGKKHRSAREKVDAHKRYSFQEGIDTLLESTHAKFDETVEIAIRLGVDPKHADQIVRGAVVLPHGTGKPVKVLVFAKGEKEKEALDAGADYVGSDGIIEQIKNGWLDFDKAIATPDMMGAVGKIGKVLGPRGLMPNVKLGTVTFDVIKAIKEFKAGKVEFRVDRSGVVHAPVGKVSFGREKLLQNVSALLELVLRLKPASSKGTYLRGIAISSTMGPGIRMDPLEVKEILK
jgi:large subunit ribosomal protein L1